MWRSCALRRGSSGGGGDPDPLYPPPGTPAFTCVREWSCVDVCVCVWIWMCVCVDVDVCVRVNRRQVYAAVAAERGGPVGYVVDGVGDGACVRRRWGVTAYTRPRASRDVATRPLEGVAGAVVTPPRRTYPVVNFSNVPDVCETCHAFVRSSPVRHQRRRFLFVLDVLPYQNFAGRTHPGE